NVTYDGSGLAAGLVNAGTFPIDPVTFATMVDGETVGRTTLSIPLNAPLAWNFGDATGFTIATGVSVAITSASGNQGEAAITITLDSPPNLGDQILYDGSGSAPINAGGISLIAGPVGMIDGPAATDSVSIQLDGLIYGGISGTDGWS